MSVGKGRVGFREMARGVGPMTVTHVLLAQGAYYALTGIAPFVSRRAFERVTGPKHDWWLVQTVGGVVTPVGLGLIAAGVRGRVTAELVGIAAGCAAGLTTIDVYHSAGSRISKIYLVDAACQAAILVLLRRAVAESGVTSCTREAGRHGT